MKLPNPSATRPRGRGRAIILATVLGVLLATPVVAGWLLRATSASGKSSSLAFAIDVKSPATEGAQGPRTPAAQNAPTGSGPVGGGGGGGGRWRGMGPMFPPPTQQELGDTISFFREHAPNRFALFDQLDEGPPRRRVLRVMINRYRQLQRFKDSDPDLYSLGVKQFELQDEAFGILRNAVSNGSPDAETLSKLREKVRDLTRLGIQEREKRVDRLERMLQEERSRLDADKADPDAVIERHMKQIRNEAEEVKRHFDQLQDFQRSRDDRATTNAPTTAPTTAESR